MCLNEENGEEFIYGALNDHARAVKLKLSERSYCRVQKIMSLEGPLSS